MTAIKPS